MAGSTDVTRTLRKRETRDLLRQVNASALWLRDRLLQRYELDELEVLNDYLRHVLLRLDESGAEGRLLR